jgi:hypothetical protein
MENERQATYGVGAVVNPACVDTVVLTAVVRGIEFGLITAALYLLLGSPCPSVWRRLYNALWIIINAVVLTLMFEAMQEPLGSRADYLEPVVICCLSAFHSTWRSVLSALVEGILTLAKQISTDPLRVVSKIKRVIQNKEEPYD